MPAYGTYASIGYAPESTYDTYAPASYFLEALSETMQMKIERFNLKNIFGKGFQPDDKDGLRRVEGDIVFPAHPTPLGYFLMAACGVQSFTTAGSRTMTFQPSAVSEYDTNRPLPSLSFEIDRDVTSAFAISGAQVNRIAFAVQPNQELRVTAGIIARTVTLRDATPVDSITFPNSPVYPFTFDSASIEIGGSASAIVEAFECVQDNMLEGVAVLNATNKISRAFRKDAPDISANLTMQFNDVSDFLRFSGQSEFAIRASFAQNSFTFSISLPRCVFSEYPVNLGGRERVIVKAAVKARYHTGSGTSIRYTITNAQSTYLV